MHICIYRKVDACPGIEVFEEVWRQMPLAEIIRRNLGSLARLESPGVRLDFQAHRTEKNQSEDSVVPCQLINFRHSQGGEKLIQGLIYYNSTAALMEFLRGRIFPNGQGPLSSLLKRSLDRDGNPDLSFLEQHIEMCRSGRYTSIAFNAGDQVNLPLVCWMRDFRETGLIPIAGLDDDLWAWSFPLYDSHRVIFVLDYLRTLGRWQVPGWQLVKVFDAMAPEPERFHEMNFMVFDGQTCSWHSSLDEIAPGLLENLDRLGRMFFRSELDILPFSHLQVRAVLRIPPGSDFAAKNKDAEDSIKAKEPPHPHLSHPALVLDSHYPIFLGPQTEVIDSLEAAAWLLARTTRGIFIPGQVGRLFPAKYIPEHESFLILAEPRRL